jgi:glycosyltransferase involved in cell wall biosynthesis
LTAFIGLFNAETHLRAIEETLLSQLLETPIVFVDNCSEDQTWELLQRLSPQILERAVLVRNAINLGSLGSLYANLSMLATPWVATLHQDDIYFSSHLKTLNDAISKASKSTICVFSDMGTGVSQEKEKTIPTLIRPSWVMRNWSREDLFLANLKLQTISFPSAAFRVDSLVSTMVPWHSSTFGDTEISLKLASLGDVEPIWEQTMAYIDNPVSESHDLLTNERTLGSAVSLVRVMTSSDFVSLCKSVDLTSRGNFADQIFLGLEARLGVGHILDFVKLISAESMSFAWDYSEPKSRLVLEEHYELVGASRTSKLLLNLGSFHGNPNTKKNSRHSVSQAEPVTAQLTSSPPRSYRTTNSHVFRILRLVSGLIPLRLRRVVTRRLTRILGLFSPGSPWSR